MSSRFWCRLGQICVKDQQVAMQPVSPLHNINGVQEFSTIIVAGIAKVRTTLGMSEFSVDEFEFLGTWSWSSTF